jgi:DNA-binding transcriptional MerR regulator/methylmalonyl-CoA mutase cobalamin-binding subunit
MSNLDQTPTFNLKAVVRETGVKPDTLRAWERRYGLPQPQRSAGRHRLYSQHDIETIKWLIARQQEGMSISRAVDLWHSLEAEGQDPLQAMAYARSEVKAPTVSLSGGGTVTELRRAWIAACLTFNRQGAEQVVAQAFALYPTEVACTELFQKGLAEIGEGWYRGEITVQQEHFASELAIRRLEALVEATPPPTRPGRILIGCPPEEEHTFSPLSLTLLLRRRGWDVLYLGANVPLEHLEATITAAKPQLVILSAQQLYTAAKVLEMARLLQRQHIPLAYGGRVFNLLPALRSRIPGYFLGERLDLAPQYVEQVLSSSRMLPPVQVASEAYQQALVHYRERRSLIEVQVWQAAESVEGLSEYLTIANTHLARDIMAALMLGDMSLLGNDVGWIERLLGNYRLPTDLLRRYLNAYYQAAKTYLDERGAPILDWLARI